MTRNTGFQDMIDVYNHDDVDFWTKYFYENAGSTRIVSDSFYGSTHFPNGIDGPMVGFLVSGAVYHTYDNKGRIIKDSIRLHQTYYNDTSTIINLYPYDAAGNRIGRTYDDKINIHRTNKVWMFIDRDYSVNNPFTAETYNSIGLPTKVNLPNETNSQSVRFLFLGLYNPIITYKCK